MQHFNEFYCFNQFQQNMNRILYRHNNRLYIWNSKINLHKKICKIYNCREKDIDNCSKLSGVCFL